MFYLLTFIYKYARLVQGHCQLPEEKTSMKKLGPALLIVAFFLSFVTTAIGFPRFGDQELIQLVGGEAKKKNLLKQQYAKLSLSITNNIAELTIQSLDMGVLAFRIDNYLPYANDEIRFEMNLVLVEINARLVKLKEAKGRFESLMRVVNAEFTRHTSVKDPWVYLGLGYHVLDTYEAKYAWLKNSYKTVCSNYPILYSLENIPAFCY